MILLKLNGAHMRATLAASAAPLIRGVVTLCDRNGRRHRVLAEAAMGAKSEATVASDGAVLIRTPVDPAVWSGGAIRCVCVCVRALWCESYDTTHDGVCIFVLWLCVDVAFLTFVSL